MKWCGNLSINLFLRSSTPPPTTTTHLVRRGRLSISVPRCHRLNYKLIVTPLRSQTMRKKQYKVQHVAVINQGSCFGGATMLRLYGSTDTPTSLGAATTAMAAATLTNFARQPQHTIIAFCSQVKTVLHLVLLLVHEFSLFTVDAARYLVAKVHTKWQTGTPPSLQRSGSRRSARVQACVYIFVIVHATLQNFSFCKTYVQL